MEKLDQLLKMIDFLTNGLREFRFPFKSARVPSIGLTGGFNVLKDPMEILKVCLNYHHTVVKTAGKKLFNTFIHDINVQNKYLKWKYYFIITI